MSLAFSDGFSLYQDLTGATLLKNWAGSMGSNNLNFRSGGRWGSKSYSVNIDTTGSARGYMTHTLSMTGSTSILGVAIQAGSAPTNGVRLLSISNGSATVALTWLSDRRIAITDGAATTHFTTPSSLASSTWYYLELKVIWHASTGRIIYRMDTSQFYDSGTTLALGSSTNATSLLFGNSAGANASLNTTYTDLLIMDSAGSTLNDFQGDIRIETLLPDSDGVHSDWAMPNNTLLTSVNQARITTDTSGWTTLTGSPTLSRVATNGPTQLIPSFLQLSGLSGIAIISTPNGTSGYPVTAGQSLGIGLYYGVSGGGSGTDVSLRFYDSGGSQVGADILAGGLWQGNSAVWAWNTFSVTVPATATTCAIILTRTNGNTSKYTAFVLSSTATVPRYVDPSGAHYFETADSTYDSDSTYVTTNTVGAKETYSMDPLLSSTGTILGVTAYAVARKESASTHTINTVMRTNGADNSGTAVNLPDNLTYQAMNDFYLLNPTTGVPWTRADVGSIETGVELPS